MAWRWACLCWARWEPRALDAVAALDAALHEQLELARVVGQHVRCLLVQRVVGVGILRGTSSEHGSDMRRHMRSARAELPGTRGGRRRTMKRNWRPKTMDDMLSTGFQSSRRMLRQMFPSRSMLGWYTCGRVSSCGQRAGRQARAPLFCT
jgi:hypothetical protein